ncbi:hypothetical protein ACIRLA_36615 [Streptomyces sp. NPDC102364]|uniref:hypothetical protein n=1 Tax=Streptomyces sp. NPDC102364 TaxID=3366161 RepID=UPI0038111C84
MNSEFSRRTLLRRFTGVAAGEGLLAPLAAQAADVPSNTSKSANGWDVLDAHSPETAIHAIPGTNLRVTLRRGDAATVLAYVAQRFHYDVMPLEASRGQVLGYAADLQVKSDFESNHLSGTALALYPDNYPLGSKGNLYPNQVTAIRDIVAELQGVVKWGGDMQPVKESTFFLDVPPDSTKLALVARTLKEWGVTPGKGAGTQNVEDPKRMAAAKKLADKQAA